MDDKIVSLEENSSSDSSKIKLSEEKEKELLGHILRTWEVSDSARNWWKAKKQEGLQLYFGIVPAKDFPFKNSANNHVPLIRTIKDTLHSNLMGSIDPEKPVTALPVGPEDAAKARKVEKLLNWQLLTQTNYYNFVDEIVDIALVYGHAPVKVRYVIEKKGGKKIFDGIKVDVLQPERVLFPPDASSGNVDDWEYCIHEIVMTKSDVKERMNSGKWKNSELDLDDLPGLTSTFSDVSSTVFEQVRGFQSGINQLEQSSSLRKYYTVIEWYGKYDLDEDGVDEPILAVVLKEAKAIMLAVGWEGPRPIRFVRLIPFVHKPVGESVPDILAMIQKELNTIHNQRVDAVTLANIPWGFYDPMQGFNPSEIHLQPGTLIPTNGPPSQAVYFPIMQTRVPEMMNEESALFSYAERMLGAGANQQGIAQPKVLSATEIASIDRRSGIRFLLIFNRLKEGLKSIFDLILYLDSENISPETQVRITGLDSSAPVFETIKRSDIVGNFDVIINGTSIVDEQAAKAEQMSAYQLGIMNPIVSSDPIALYNLTRDTMIKMGIKNVDSYLRQPEDTIPKNPNEEHNLFLQEESVKPNRTENIPLHIKAHAEFINSDNFKLLSDKGKALAIRHYLDTLQMDKLLKMQDKIRQIQMVNSMLLQSQVSGQMPGQGETPNGTENKGVSNNQGYANTGIPGA